jgi:hypothetical protein
MQFPHRRSHSHCKSSTKTNTTQEMAGDELVKSDNPMHPANLICELCRLFYGMLILFEDADLGNGWVTGTGGGMTIREGYNVSPCSLRLVITFSLLRVVYRKKCRFIALIVDSSVLNLTTCLSYHFRPRPIFANR